MTRAKPEERPGLARAVRRGRALVGVPDPHDTEAPGWASVILVLLLLGAAWVLSYAGGRAGVVPPHWFYLPIGVAASRFRYRGAVIVALASGILAGPLLRNVGSGAGQAGPQWVERAALFIVIGLFVAWLVNLYREATFELRSSRAVAMALMGEVGRPAAPRAIGRRRVEGALLPGGMAIALQPIVRIDDGEPIGFEALARFPRPPERPPKEWFTEAWSVGLGVDLELTALQAAVELLPDIPEGFLSVNLSPATLVSPVFRSSIWTLPPDRLVVEMTEHVPVSDYPLLRESLMELREQGVRYAVDDAGAGYASLRHVIRLEPDIIKVDTELVRGVDRDPLLRSVTSALIRFGDETGALMVAEGVESEEELRVLRSLGARFAQGFLFAPPTLPDRITVSITGSSPWRRGGGGATPRTGTRG